MISPTLASRGLRCLSPCSPCCHGLAGPSLARTQPAVHATRTAMPGEPDDVGLLHRDQLRDQELWR